MELLDGESLADRLARGPLPFDEASAIALTVVETLAAVHERGLIHRDLKPANIFLTRHGVKLLDFGLARDVGPAEAVDTRLTQQRPGRRHAEAIWRRNSCAARRWTIARTSSRSARSSTRC